MVINCQLFIEMHNFFNYKMMSVLIPASGLSFCSTAPVLPGEQSGAAQGASVCGSRLCLCQCNKPSSNHLQQWPKKLISALKCMTPHQKVSSWMQAAVAGLETSREAPGGSSTSKLPSTSVVFARFMGVKGFSIRFFCPCTSLGHPLRLQQQFLCLAFWRRWKEIKVGGHVMCLDKNVQETEPKKKSLFTLLC